MALAQRTLTVNEVPGFRDFCICLAAVRELDQRIALLGLVTEEGRKYADQRLKWAKELKGALKDFKLTGFGKPATSQAPPLANRWAAIAQGA